jgi:hypothetical protein
VQGCAVWHHSIHRPSQQLAYGILKLAFVASTV